MAPDRFIDPHVRLLCPRSGSVLLVIDPMAFKARRTLEQRYYCRRCGWRERREHRPCARTVKNGSGPRR